MVVTVPKKLKTCRYYQPVNVQQGRRCAEEACEAVLVLREQVDDKADAVLLDVYS